MYLHVSRPAAGDSHPLWFATLFFAYIRAGSNTDRLKNFLGNTRFHLQLLDLPGVFVSLLGCGLLQMLPDVLS